MNLLRLNFATCSIYSVLKASDKPVLELGQTLLSQTRGFLQVDRIDIPREYSAIAPDKQFAVNLHVLNPVVSLNLRDKQSRDPGTIALAHPVEGVLKVLICYS